MDNYTEKRRHYRACAGLPVIYRYDSTRARNRRVENAGRTINISAGGLCMAVDESITPETPLYIKLQVRNRAIKCTGRVVRDGSPESCRGRPRHHASREIAVELALSPEDLIFLNDYLDSRPSA